MAAFPTPTGGASLLLSFRLNRRRVVIIGSNTLAASRAFSALEADSVVLVLADGGVESACEELRWRAEQKQISVLDLQSLPGPSNLIDLIPSEAQRLDTYFSTSDPVSLVCITDTILGPDVSKRRGRASAIEIVHVCRSRSIPINVTDYPDLCDFSFASTHRFVDPTTGVSTPLQVGVTTNGRGCRLAGRLRREIVAKLPKDAGSAVLKVGTLRDMAKSPADDSLTAENEEEVEPTPNQPVPQRTTTLEESLNESARRRMKWVAQVSEYWPMSRLAAMSAQEMTGILDRQKGLSDSAVRAISHHHPGDSNLDSVHALPLSSVTPPGKIYLVGSGPGHPSLLTLATHAALTRHADLVLSDKLVPAAVLSLIPSNVEVRIARKFPGNADGAQNELMEAAIEAAKKGLTVVRLKQGDPTVYGRAGEEVLYFRARGYEPVVVPGVSSVLAGPTFAGIPVTQRGAAESFVVCTGVGRQGKEVQLPGYVRSRTLVVLMGVARLPQVLDTLQADGVPLSRRDGAPYPPNTPIALIERASMPDQRVLSSTLRDISAALESIGEQRPPGMLVIGWSVLSLWGQGDVTILDNPEGIEGDDKRITAWLGEARWRVSEGVDAAWDVL